MARGHDRLRFPSSQTVPTARVYPVAPPGWTASLCREFQRRRSEGRQTLRFGQRNLSPSPLSSSLCARRQELTLRVLVLSGGSVAALIGSRDPKRVMRWYEYATHGCDPAQRVDWQDPARVMRWYEYAARCYERVQAVGLHDPERAMFRYAREWVTREYAFAADIPAVSFFLDGFSADDRPMNASSVPLKGMASPGNAFEHHHDCLTAHRLSLDRSAFDRSKEGECHHSMSFSGTQDPVALFSAVCTCY